eukprot:239397_1
MSSTSFVYKYNIGIGIIAVFCCVIVLIWFLWTEFCFKYSINCTKAHHVPKKQPTNQPLTNHSSASSSVPSQQKIIYSNNSFTKNTDKNNPKLLKNDSVSFSSLTPINTSMASAYNKPQIPLQIDEEEEEEKKEKTVERKYTITVCSEDDPEIPDEHNQRQQLPELYAIQQSE